MFERFAGVFVFTAQPRAPHVTVDAVVSAGVAWVYELAAGLGHALSLAVSVAQKHRLTAWNLVG
jgi:hypothetical protein